MVSYKRPPNQFNLLTNYKKLSHGDHGNQSHFSPRSFPCRRCALCGSFGKNKESMVSPTHILRTPNNSFHLTQHLTCRHYGIYVAICCICKEQYVGQTKNRLDLKVFGVGPKDSEYKSEFKPYFIYIFTAGLTLVKTRTKETCQSAKALFLLLKLLFFQFPQAFCNDINCFFMVLLKMLCLHSTKRF